MTMQRHQLKAVQAEKNRQKRKRRRRRRTTILLIEIIMILLLSGALYVVAKYDLFQKVRIDDNNLEINEGVSQEGYTTIALFGGDSRDGQLEAGTHADTIIIVSIDNKTREIRMASLYRDTFLLQADDSYNKANYAYFNGGPEEAIGLLNRNMDLDIQDYVTVDFKALVDAIDLMGGLDIDIQDEEVQYVNEFLQETADVAGTQANFLTQGGEQHLDGAQAVTYARIRSTEGGDLTRTKRQRLVIEKIFEKAQKMNLAVVNDIVNTVFPQVSTSFSLGEIISLAKDLPRYKLGDQTGFPFEADPGGYYEPAGSVVIPVDMYQNVIELHTFLYPKQKEYTPSAMINRISSDIVYLTGVTTDSQGVDTNTIQNNNALEQEMPQNDYVSEQEVPQSDYTTDQEAPVYEDNTGDGNYSGNGDGY